MKKKKRQKLAKKALLRAAVRPGLRFTESFNGFAEKLQKRIDAIEPGEIIMSGPVGRTVIPPYCPNCECEKCKKQRPDAPLAKSTSDENFRAQLLRVLRHNDGISVEIKRAMGDF